MVLSTMAANEPERFVGVAPEAQYLLVRCEDERTESLAEEDYWAFAAEYADSCGVDVINSSLGYHGFDDASTNHHYYEQDGNSITVPCDSVILAAGMRARTQLADSFMGITPEFDEIGDCVRARTVEWATKEGFYAAIRI